MSGRGIYDRYNKPIVCAAFLLQKLRFVLYFLLLFFKNNNGFIGVFVRWVNFKNKARFVSGIAYVAPYTVLKNLGSLDVGDNFSLHEFCYIDAIGGVSIGSNVSIAHGSSLVSFEHTWGLSSVPIKYNPTKTASIKIGSDVWIGCGARILAGSTIGDRVVIAAGSVVRGSLEGGYLYAGVPAKKIKPL